MIETLKKELHQAWAYRNSQQLEAAEKAYNAIQSRTQSTDRLPEELHIEVKLLKASLLRGRQQLEDSETCLIEVKNRFDNSNIVKIPFNYYCQRGLNLFYQGYFPSALEYFSRAQKIADTAEEEALATGNLLLCLDNLNLPTVKAVQNLKALVNELSEDYFHQAILPQLESFEIRQAFRQGNISQVFTPPLRSSDRFLPEQFSQSQYVKLWVSHLPYINIHGVTLDVVPLIETPHFLWKHFRLRTLLFDARYGNDESVKISERIDRLYLWLWKWMVAPKTIPLSSVEECWRNLDPCEVCSQTTAEDFVLLKLCLRWTRLFDTRWVVPSQEWLKKSTPPNIQESPLFQYEYLLLDYLEALQLNDRSQSKILLSQLKAHPFYTDTFLNFYEIINGTYRQEVSSHPAFSLGRRWFYKSKGSKTTSVGSNQKPLVINLQNFHWKYGNTEGVSKSLCLLIKALYEHESLSFDELMQICFSISTYDEDLHRAKIMNLLTRIRKVLPKDFIIFTRDQWVYTKGQIKKILFENHETKYSQWELPSIFERPCLEQNQFRMDRWIQPSIVVKKFKDKSKITRQELQLFLKLSKATTNRLLLRWQDEGFLIKQSTGRSIFYVINRTYFFRLTSKDS